MKTSMKLGLISLILILVGAVMMNNQEKHAEIGAILVFLGAIGSIIAIVKRNE